MTFLRRFATTLTVLTAGSACAMPPAAAQWDRIAEEDAIYRMLLQQKFDKGKGSVIIDAVPTSSHGRLLDRLQPDPATADGRVLAEVVADFTAINAATRSLRSLATDTTLLLVPDSVITAMRNADLRTFWNQYHARFPDRPNIIRWTRPGFSADRNMALIEAGSSCGGLCGSGELMLVHKVDGVWKVKAVLSAWVS